MDIKSVKAQIDSDIDKINSLEALEAFSVKYLGRKGVIAELTSQIPSLAAEQRPDAGRDINSLKNQLKDLIDSHRAILSRQASFQKPRSVDITLPGTIQDIGNKHPLTQVMDEICGIFVSLGFKLFEGPEIETEYNNFQALNIPLNHPSCDPFDTFYLDTGFAAKDTDNTEKKQQKPKANQRLLLRSHTSPGQIRVMKKYKPPVAAIVPGKVYRPDATDASHSFMFHQVEGFLVDKDVKFSDLKGVLEEFSKIMFGADTKMRFRPHFFPFTEPSAEVDISCIICGGEGKSLAKTCSVCKGKGWLEILGCGMIHPNVFKAVGYSDGKFTGFAFGMGVERITMLKYGIDDIRIFFENDLRFLKQF
ncbi:MAG: phenylalanine--tRNA ligase subunit alpha [Candidatus Omnitrophica bacterium]|nr:phenylalanine--tRNA ligase subunit alpha [Candidatus Omnitrophota bacterium]MDD5351590.1 phenylalanine--tRNA ligase subunit alpha [Candidatus Omnitrophota bacterium]MDD5551025.1 phenylalanine--tRNA ligase subunit alpha [Candidatus Omnitrophota bacterium]